ncbi:hypothetical protein GJAV_G00126400 [Gymnothorax javanicus]|nr:hypothetical protein GJAV_G00126400 [Gymnothorax javanicus]
MQVSVYMEKMEGDTTNNQCFFEPCSGSGDLVTPKATRQLKTPLFGQREREIIAMAVRLASPCGLLSDEEECGAAVFESTAADVGGLMGTRFPRPTMPEISLISPALEPRTPQTATKPGLDRRGGVEEDSSSEKVKVYLRIRLLTETEEEKGEQQGCVFVQDNQTLILRAPKNSYNMKSSERGVAPNVHKFTFTQISGPDTSQQEFYESTMREMVRDVVRGRTGFSTRMASPTPARPTPSRGQAVKRGSFPGRWSQFSGSFRVVCTGL